MKVLVLVGLALLASAPAVSLGQTHHKGSPMGFDQMATTHHFYLYDNGGAIEVLAKTDATTLADVRHHLEMLPMAFGAGDFSTPRAVHENVVVAGADALQRLRSEIEYRYRDIELGGRVEITADGEALAAIHAFLRFQISDHQTGDPLQVRARP